MNILITGASKGIGWGLVNYYLQQGHQVYGISRTGPLDHIKHQNYRHLSLDILAIQKTKSQLLSFLSKVEHLDLVILNAGMLTEVKDMKDTTIEEMDRAMKMNVWTNKTIIDIILENIDSVGKVIGMSSGASISGHRGWNGYSISKAALNMLIRLYANENTRTSFYAFAPGLVDTAMQDYLCEEVDQEKFPSAKRIAAARHTEAMPTPQEAGAKIALAFAKLHHYPSGSFVDIRKMEI